MANTFTSLAADIYEAAERVGRELVGGVNSIRINGGAQQAAKGDTVRSAFTRTPIVSTTYSPAMTIPEGTDQTVDNKTMSLDTFANVQIPYTGEDQRHLNNGAGFQTVWGNQFMQAMRVITNKIELDTMAELGAKAGNAYGTAGTTPFASNQNDLAQVMKQLLDRGCPDDGQISGIYDTTAAANLQSLANLYKVNEAGGEALLRRGELGQLMNINLKRSGQVAQPAIGSGASYLVNGALTAGATTITVDTGSGTIVAGDVVVFAGSTIKYVVATALSGGSFTIQSPLLTAIADNAAVTVSALSRRNVVIHRDAAELAIRPIALPQGGDAATDVMEVFDPVSGLAFSIAHYKGYKKAMYEVSCLYGVKLWIPDFALIHLG